MKGNKNYNDNKILYNKDKRRYKSRSRSYSKENASNYIKDSYNYNNNKYQNNKYDNIYKNNNKNYKSNKYYKEYKDNSYNNSFNKDYNKYREEIPIKKNFSPKLNSNINEFKDNNYKNNNKNYEDFKYCKNKDTEQGNNKKSSYNYNDNYNKYKNEYSKSTEDSKKDKTKIKNNITIFNLSPDITLNEIESSLLEASILNQVKIPKVTYSEILRTAYVSFEDNYESERFTKKLKGRITINNKEYSFDYSLYDNNDIFEDSKNEDVNNIDEVDTTLLSKNELKNKYIKEFNLDYRIKEDIVVHEDWICNKCKGLNYSRRDICYKCSNSRNKYCTTIPHIVNKRNNNVIVNSNEYYNSLYGNNKLSFTNKSELLPTNSLIAKCSEIKNSSETELFNLFSVIGNIKDIRMIRDKTTLEYKEFAFIEFFSVDEAADAMQNFVYCPLQLNNKDIKMEFSKFNNAASYSSANFNNSLLNNCNYDINKINSFYDNLLESNVIDKRDNYNFSQQLNEGPNINFNVPYNDKLKLNEISKLQREIDLNKITIIDKENAVKSNKYEEQINFKRENYLKDECLKKLDIYESYKIDIIKDKESQEAEFKKKEDITIVNLTEDVFICYICSRKFTSKEKLLNHEMLSNLHKEKLKEIEEKNAKHQSN